MGEIEMGHFLEMKSHIQKVKHCTDDNNIPSAKWCEHYGTVMVFSIDGTVTF